MSLEGAKKMDVWAFGVSIDIKPIYHAVRLYLNLDVDPSFLQIQESLRHLHQSLVDSYFDKKMARYSEVNFRDVIAKRIIRIQRACLQVDSKKRANMDDVIRLIRLCELEQTLVDDDSENVTKEFEVLC